MCALNLHPVGIPGFIVQGNLGWRGICHVRTWLNSINDPRDSCYLQQSVLGPKDCSKQWRKFASKWQKPAEKWRTFPASIFLLVSRLRKTVRVHIDHLMHAFVQLKLVAQAKPSKTPFLAASSLWDQHGLLTTTLKTEDYRFHSWWRVWPGNYVFWLNISPCLKFCIVGFSRYGL